MIPRGVRRDVLGAHEVVRLLAADLFKAGLRVFRISRMLLLRVASLSTEAEGVVSTLDLREV